MCRTTVTTGYVSRVEVVKLITQRDNCQYQLKQSCRFNENAKFDSIIQFLAEIVENQQFSRSFLSLEMTMKYRRQKLCKIYFASFKYLIAYLPLLSRFFQEIDCDNCFHILKLNE